jgi:RNA polymerase sigma-70 factor, ECF subfamily
MKLKSTSPLETAAERRARDADRLVAAARAGDPAAFDLLVRRFRPRIYALALHLSGSASDADDVTQDAFVQAYRNIGGFEGRSHFFTWLYRITVNKALDAQRERKRGSCLLDDARIEIALRVDAPADPRRALELRETYAALLQALDALSPSLKSAVVLTCLQGLSYQEAAVVLDTSEGAIAVRIHEARRLLRQTIEARGSARERSIEHARGRASKGTASAPSPARVSSELLALASML